MHKQGTKHLGAFDPLDDKQDTLTTAQLAAVNSGVTADTVQQVASNTATIENIAEQIGADDYVWAKPADWIDIRSGALNNSIYLLVGHSVPTESEGTYTVATYPQCHLNCTVSTTANTYDVYVDGVKVATTASGTKTVLNWGSLYTAGTVSTLYQTTYPSALVMHIVRITPTTDTDTLTRFWNNVDSNNTQQGILWAHFQLDNAIRITAAFGYEERPRNTLLEAVTAKDDKITYTVSSSIAASGFYSAFAYCSSLVKIPVLVAENTTYASGVYISFRNVPAKKVIIKNNKGTEAIHFLNNTKVKEFDIENGAYLGSGILSGDSAVGVTNLKRLPTFNQSNNETVRLSRLDALEPTFIDDSHNSSRTYFACYGDSEHSLNGLKGLIVSSSAPFSHSTSPQINVSYTGLDRAALVRLFNSMPTVSDSQVCDITGATGANDLSAADLLIATNKGWTITR